MQLRLVLLCAMSVSNAMLLEHVNFNLGPDAIDRAEAFFVRGLGLAKDPRPAERGRGHTLLWANSGLQQFHLPVDAVDGDGNQVLDAKVCQQLDGELVLDVRAGSINAVRARLDKHGYETTESRDVNGSRVRISPSVGLGNAFVLRESGVGDGAKRPLIGGPSDGCKGQPGFRSDDPSSDGPIGISAVRIRAPVPALRLIASFWREFIGARVELTHAAADAHTIDRVVVHFDGARDPADSTCALSADANAAHSTQTVEFVAPHLLGEPGAPLLPYDGHHLALYLRDWKGAYDRAAAAGLLYQNLRFSDRCATWDQAQECQQFRTLAMCAPGEADACVSGALGAPAANSSTRVNDAVVAAWALATPPDAALDDLQHFFRLELEVRSLEHVSCPY